MFKVNFDPNLFISAFPAVRGIQPSILESIFMSRYIDSGLASSKNSFREEFVRSIQDKLERDDFRLL